MKWKRLSIVIIIIVALIISIPFYVFNGTVKYTYRDTRFTAQSCTGVSQGVPYVTLSFSCLYLFAVIVVLVIMAVLYVRICRVIFGQQKFRVHMENVEKSPRETLTNSSNIDFKENKDGEPVKENQDGVQAEYNQEGVPAEGKHDDVSSKEKQNGVPASVINRAYNKDDKLIRQTTCLIPSSKNSQSSKRNMPRSRITIMFLVITIAFAISFIPRVVIMVLESTTFDNRGVSKGLDIFMRFLHSAYIFNNCVNPFIYGCMDKKFQLELRKLICCYKT